MKPLPFAAIRKGGGSYTRVADRDSRTGRPEGLPRTAAIKKAGVVRPEIDGLRDPIADSSATDPQYLAVAQVLSYVYQIRQHQAGKGKLPDPLKDYLPIPPDLRRDS